MSAGLGPGSSASLPARSNAAAPARRSFDLGAVLSVTTGRYLASDVGDLYELLEWVTGDQPFTHQLPRFSEEAAPAILAEHPALASITVPEDLGGQEACRAWLAMQAARVGDRLPITALIAKDRHVVTNPIVDLAKMMGGGQ